MRVIMSALFAFLIVFSVAGMGVGTAASEGPVTSVAMTASAEFAAQVAQDTSSQIQKAEGLAGTCTTNASVDGSSMQLAQNCGQCGSAGCCRARTCICENGPGGCGSCVSQ